MSSEDILAAHRKTRRKPKAKKVAKPRVPRTRCNGTMTEAAYFGWIRSQLRAASIKWRPIYEVRKEGRRPATAAEKKKWGPQTKFVNTCHNCGDWYPNKALDVDHHPPVGSLGTTEDEFKALAGSAILRLFCERIHLRRLCNSMGLDCHQTRTNES